MDSKQMYAKQPDREKDYRTIYRPETDFVHYANQPDYTLNTSKRYRLVHLPFERADLIYTTKFTSKQS